ncbi:MAG: DUF5685 family protein, partial [Coprococcus sp.]
MFGYIVTNQQELKLKDFEQYHRYYCGLCRALKKRHGAKGQMSLSYDMTFLVILLTGLYEPDNISGESRCIPHPFKSHEYIVNDYSEYVADMNVILTYYKCMDDWNDEKKLIRKLYADMLLSKSSPVHENYKEKIAVIVSKLKSINELENAGSDDLDTLSGYFGDVMAEICAVKHDEWEKNLRTIGYYLGKYIYILDAYDDIEKDIKEKCFNPLISRLAKGPIDDIKSISVKEWQHLADWTKDVLMMMAANMAKEF